MIENYGDDDILPDGPALCYYNYGPRPTSRKHLTTNAARARGGDFLDVPATGGNVSPFLTANRRASGIGDVPGAALGGPLPICWPT
jgi:hypothetical protein